VNERTKVNRRIKDTSRQLYDAIRQNGLIFASSAFLIGILGISTGYLLQTGINEIADDYLPIFGRVLVTVSSSLFAASIVYLVFDSVLRRFAERRIEKVIIDSAVSSKALSTEKSHELTSKLMEIIFDDAELPRMVSDTLSSWASDYNSYLKDLHIHVVAVSEDDYYYKFFVSRRFYIPKKAIEKRGVGFSNGNSSFTVRCLKLNEFYNRSQLKGMPNDYTWAFASSRDSSPLSEACFELKSFLVDDFPCKIPNYKNAENSSFQSIDYVVNIEKAIKAAGEIVKIEIEFEVLQAKRFSFYGISSYQPTYNFSTYFDFKDTGISNVFVMEYFRDDNNVDLSRPYPGVVELSAKNWVLPGNAAIFSWAEGFDPPEKK